MMRCIDMIMINENKWEEGLSFPVIYVQPTFITFYICFTRYFLYCYKQTRSIHLFFTTFHNIERFDSAVISPLPRVDAEPSAEVGAQPGLMICRDHMKNPT